MNLIPLRINPAMRLLLLPLLPVLLIMGHLSAQDEFKKYVNDNTLPLATIQPDSPDDDGLRAIGNAIGESRIVMLGEQDHGDAPTFLAKTRLIRYLHEKKGFNVLAFESDFFGLTEGWDRLPKDAPAIDSFIRGNIFPIWTYCNTCHDLFYSYIPATFRSGNPLNLSGFDCQVILRYSARYLTGWLDSVMRGLGLPIVNSTAYTTEVLPMIDSVKRWYSRPADAQKMATAAAWADTIANQASGLLKKDDFRWLVINSLVSELREYRNLKDPHIVAESRDGQMARNLAWLTDVRYAGQKIIVWAASAHIGKPAGNFPDVDYYNTTTMMGSAFTRDSIHRRETYVLGFTSFEGRAGRLQFKKYELYKPRPGAFERWFDPSLAYAFIDFKGYNTMNSGANEPFIMYGFGHVPVKGVWNKVFDGIIYIKDMYPCELEQ